MDNKLPTFIKHNSASRTSALFLVSIRGIEGFNKASFSFAVDTLDEALFYRNYVLDLIGRGRPDNAAPAPTYRSPKNPDLYAPIPQRKD